MKITGRELLDNNEMKLTASFTTDHPCSSYGQPVMLIKEWDDIMSHENWVLYSFQVIDATEDELINFKKWYKIIEASILLVKEGE